MNSIITRGLGSHTKLVSQGYGGTFYAVQTSAGLLRPRLSAGGKRHSRGRDEDVIVLTASLKEVNGESTIPKSVVLRSSRDYRKIDVRVSRRKKTHTGPTVTAKIRR